MKIRVLLIFLLLCLSVNACTSKKTVNVEKKEITWVYNLYEALLSAEQNNKPLMVDFYADWCGWCKKLDRDTYADPKVAELSDGFVCVKVDTTRDEISARKYKVKGLPTVVFMDSKGEIISRIEGYRDKKFFVKIMSEISGE
ncbi:MAG: thioredoxin family protein [Elusimicrobia bacterium]|nr:thioredoxin family protein [Elusimicrobiota bacterium]